ncbi:MAG: hypothetical protein ICV83_10090 [Cytophagales bacterium]|nr:hypothetical protein [Cytophagales bacterium]
MKNNNFGQGDASENIKASLDELEALRTAELQQAEDLLQQKQQHLRLERKRLAAKYGEQYPEVQWIDERLQFEEERGKTLKAEAERSKTPAAPYSVTSWRVNGLVLDEAGKESGAVTVYLVDEQQQRVEGAEPACSDARGYYAITLEKEAVEKLKDKKLFLAAVSGNSRKPRVVPDPLQARSGIIDYRDILLKDDPCDDPLERKDESRN